MADEEMYGLYDVLSGNPKDRTPFIDGLPYFIHQIPKNRFYAAAICSSSSDERNDLDDRLRPSAKFRAIERQVLGQFEVVDVSAPLPSEEDIGLSERELMAALEGTELDQKGHNAALDFTEDQ